MPLHPAILLFIPKIESSKCLDGDSPQAILHIVSEKWSGGDSWILLLF